MSVETAYSHASEEQAYLGVIAGVALGTAGIVREPASPSLAEANNLRETFQRLLAAGERATEAWRSYLEMDHEGRHHALGCLGGSLAHINVVLRHLRTIDRLHEELSGISGIWPENFSARLRELIDELDEVAETLALGLDDEFCAEVERRLAEAKAESSNEDRRRGAGRTGRPGTH